MQNEDNRIQDVTKGDIQWAYKHMVAWSISFSVLGIYTSVPSGPLCSNPSMLCLTVQPDRAASTATVWAVIEQLLDLFLTAGNMIPNSASHTLTLLVLITVDKLASKIYDDFFFLKQVRFQRWQVVTLCRIGFFEGSIQINNMLMYHLWNNLLWLHKVVKISSTCFCSIVCSL